MSKLRSVNTKFWDDPFIVELDPTDKLIFLYLITNSLTNILGIYEISTRKISFDTGVSIERVQKALEGFERVRKAYFEENYIVLPNWLKNQNLNPNMKKAVEKEFNELPEWLRNRIVGNHSKGFSNGYETIRKGLVTLRKVEDEDEREREGEGEEELNKNILLSKVDESTLDDKEKKYYQIAFSFWELVKNNLSELDIKSPATEQAKFKTWVDPVRLLIEKDKKTLDEFREIFRFLQVDEFWKEQIRATSKLRQKNKDNEMYFDVLLIKARNNEKKQSSQNNKSGVSEDYKKSILNRLLHSESSETT